METFESTWKDPQKTPEQKLWIAVLETAMADAMTHRDPTQKEDARRWFRDAGKNFRLVCDLANYDYGFVRQRVLSVID